MKKVLVIVFFVVSSLYSQENFNNIKLSSTPAATLIGLQNKELNTAHSYEVLYTELISPIVSSENKIPLNINLELSPFFLESRDIVLDEINSFHRIKLSIASSNVTEESGKAYSRAAFGFRTSLIPPKYEELDGKHDLMDIIEKLNDKNNYPDDNYFRDKDNLLANINDPLIIEIVKKYHDKFENDSEFRDLMKDKLQKFMNKFKSENKEPNFSLDFAGAIALDFPENTLSYSRISRWGTWLSVNYGFEKITLAGLLRLSNYSFDPDIIFENSIFTDLGLNITLQFDKLTISAEYIGKIGLSDSDTISSSENFDKVTEHKVDGSIGYQISDNYLISLSYSEAKGNSDYFANKMNQLMLGISAAIFNFN